MTLPRRSDRTLWWVAAALAAAGVTLLLLPTAAPPPPPDASQQNDQHLAAARSPGLDHPSPTPASTAAPPPLPRASAPAAAAPPAPAPSPDPSTPGDPNGDDKSTIPPTAPADAEPWREVLDGFAADFGAPTASHDQWVEQVSRWVTTHLAGQYQHTDPARRPRGTPTSIEPVVVGDHAVDVAIAYDTGLLLRVRAETGPEGWKVTSVIPITGPT